MATKKKRKSKPKIAQPYYTTTFGKIPVVTYYGSWKSGKRRSKDMTGVQHYRVFINMYSKVDDQHALADIMYEGEITFMEQGTPEGLSRVIWNTMLDLAEGHGEENIDWKRSYAKIRRAVPSDFIDKD